MALRARKVLGNFEKQAPSLEPIFHSSFPESSRLSIHPSHEALWACGRVSNGYAVLYIV